MDATYAFIGKVDSKAVDAFDKVMGLAKYVGDISLPGMLHAKLLLSPIPHGKITHLDTSKALNIEGVEAVLTSEDFIDNGSFGWPVKDAHVLAYQKVRYFGDPIAVVAADTPEAARAGVLAIEVEFEELPIVSDPSKALDPDTVLVPLEAPLEQGNLCEQHIVRFGNPDELLDQAETRLDRTYNFAHQEHACIETEGVLAIPEPDGSLIVFANDQSPHINRNNAAAILGLQEENVRIIQPPVGGSFGGKDDHVYQLTAQAGKLALVTGRPVRLTLTREESLLISYKREAGTINLDLGLDPNGNLIAGKGSFLADSGGYSSMTPLAAWRASMHLLGAYRYQAASVDTDVVYTNNGFSGALRGFGNTQAAAASEMMIDEIAELVGKDPVEYRLINCLKKGDLAFTGNTILHEVGLTRCIEWVRDQSSWEKTRSNFDSENIDQIVRHGLGVACYFHGSGLGGEGTDYARSSLVIERDHTITLQSGLTDYGQGSRTIFTLLAAEVLGVDPERINMLRPDTQTALETGPTVASRASMVGGNATRVAAEKLVNILTMASADLLDCDVDQIHRQGELFIGPNEEPLQFNEVVDHAFELGLQLYSQGYWQIPKIEWDFKTGTGIPYFTYSYGAQVAHVTVNTDSGEVQVKKIWAAHDGGKIIFPKGARGQLLGGIAQGLGYALTEGFEFQNGIPHQLRFSKYKIPTAVDVPDIEIKFVETNLPEGPFGAKNLAEPVMIATAPAIANAIYQATGVRCYDLPIRSAWLKNKILEQS